jgi:hypothetical protein
MTNPEKAAEARTPMAYCDRKYSIYGFFSDGRSGDFGGFSTILSVVVVLAITLLWHSSAFSQESVITPKISVAAGYDDNLFFSDQDKVSSSVLTVSPGLEIDYQTLLSSLQVSAELDILSYLDESDLNRTNQYYEVSGNHRPRERWDLFGEVKFYRDTVLNTFLEETGRAFDRTERDFFEASGRVRHDLTLVSGISAGYRFQYADYETDRYSDWDRHSGDINYSHRLKNEVDTLSIGPSYSHRKNDFNDVDAFALNVGWARDWSAITRSFASIGARYTTVKKSDGTEDDNWGVRGNIDITSQGLASRTTFRYFHELRTNVDGSDVNVDNFFLEYRRLLTERFGIGINGRLVFSYKLLDRQTEINDERFYFFEPRFFYRLTRELELSLRYRYLNNVEIRDDGDITRDRSIIWLQLEYALPMPL